MASLDLRPIDEGSLQAALALLGRGFSERTEALWRSGLKKILTTRSSCDPRPIGVIMTSEGKDIGILLTIPSQQSNDDGSVRNVVNLAAWYIDESHRWLASRMLKKIVADDDAVFLDLTPNPASEMINRKLGFERLNDGFVIFLLLFTALRARTNSKVLSFDQAGMRLTAFERRTLEQHESLGCVVGVLRSEDRFSPLIFSRIKRRGLPGARLILADSKAVITNNLSAISSFLLRKRILFLRMDAKRSDLTAGSMASRWTEPTYIKGGRSSSRVDFTYSEFVFWET
jgi:hypothetical protein